ncbi:MAG TPA: nuclear transport factor 2 family protein [Thermoanaerobaculia bacterium]|nr:nuclear transport factor 2 family protein [Thermoanaerobaculia bacterium]
MTENKRTVEKYMEAFGRSDHAEILSCLTDDVEWVLPGVFHHHGKAAFDKEIENAEFMGKPAITTTRLTEENGVVVAEGRVRTQKATGEHIHLVFCDVFEMQGGLIERLTSYLMQVPES